MSKELTLGSLFSGSGGFELVGLKTGIKPIWNSEIEPFPIRVTTKRMPNVEHLGNIEKIKGSEIEPVDIITFGSPCQDLSIAGKRAGLEGSRSNLFYEATRIIKEMRDKTNGEKPRYIIWENVPGAFSSNKGEDFHSVIKEIISIKGDKTSIPRPNKWHRAGLILGEYFSLAWRVLDARYFGVPQRRRRIFLVCDFNGQSAGKILFEPKSLPRDTTSSKEKEESSSRSFGKSINKSSETYFINDQGGERIDIYEDTASTITASSKNHPPLVFENHGQDTRYTGPLDVANTVMSTYGTGGNNQPFVVETFDIRLTSENTKDERANVYKTDVSRSISTNGNIPTANQGGVAVVYSTSKSSHHTIPSANEVSTLVATDYKDPPTVYSDNLKVRRLTPKECGRLQGFPDYWCENLASENPNDEEIEFFTKVFDEYSRISNKKNKSRKQIINWLKNPYSDSAMYKMWGNGVALSCVTYILSSLVYYVENEDLSKN